jgi:hypothetical protein
VWKLVAIAALVALGGVVAFAAAVVVVLSPPPGHGSLRTAEHMTKSLRSIVVAYLADNAAPCPTIDALRAAKAIDPASNANDPWGTPLKILCVDDDDVVVISFGPDRREGTADDIRAPAYGPP